MRNFSIVLTFVLALAPAAALADQSISSESGEWDCAKDPVVHIVHGDGSYVFKGACKEIGVEGGSNKLTIEAVDTLKLVGGSNTIDVGTLGTAKIVGAGNKLTWKQAKSGAKPKISAVGANNTFEKAK